MRVLSEATSANADIDRTAPDIGKIRIEGKTASSTQSRTPLIELHSALKSYTIPPLGRSTPMSDDLHMLLFDFNGSVEIPDADQNAVSALPDDADLLGILNKQAEVISQKIEREIRRILPPTVTVQANIQFDEGSVVITGVVALLSWAAPIVGDAAKKELGELVKLAIKRVLSRYVPGYASLTELRVTPQSSTPTPPSPPSDTDRTSRTFAGDKISVTTALLVVTVLILILQVVTLLVHLR